jgi:hypothetical protein
MTNALAILVAVLVQVESQGRNVSGDEGRAAGVLQMRTIAVKEANRITGRRWTPADRWNPGASREMCHATLTWHARRGVRNPVDLAARWRNPHGDAPSWYRYRLYRELQKTELRKGETWRNVTL